MGLNPLEFNPVTKRVKLNLDSLILIQGTMNNFDKKFIIDKIQEYKLPLIPILSKSKGLHLYIFMRKFVDAAILKSFLSNLLPLF